MKTTVYFVWIVYRQNTVSCYTQIMKCTFVCFCAMLLRMFTCKQQTVDIFEINTFIFVHCFRLRFILQSNWIKNSSLKSISSASFSWNMNENEYFRHKCFVHIFWILVWMLKCDIFLQFLWSGGYRRKNTDAKKTLIHHIIPMNKRVWID